jgi:hypothetical protein
MLLPRRIDHARTAIPFREKSAKVYSREPHDPTPPTPPATINLLGYRLGHLTRRRHRPPSIERHLPEQAAMFISPMSALERITDSSQSSRRVRKVPIVLQKSQKALRLIFRQRTKQATIADQCSLKPIPGIACAFGARRRSPPHYYSIVASTVRRI